MFGTIRKHQAWLWIVIIIGTIVSFVVWWSPYSSWDLKRRTSKLYISPTSRKPVNLYGRPITYEEFDQAQREVMLDHFLKTKRWPGTDDDSRYQTEMRSIYRVLLIKKLEELDIRVSEEAVARLVREWLGDFPFSRVVAEMLQPVGLRSEDFKRFATHEAGIQQLIAVAAIDGKLINPREAEVLYRRDHEEVATEVAVFWATNFMDQVVVNPAEMRTFFTNRMGFYRVPPRIQVSYIEFPLTNFLAEGERLLTLRATNLNEVLEEEYFRRGGTNAFKGTNGLPMTEAAAKAKIRDDIRDQFALREARQRAGELGNILAEMQPPNKADNLDRLAAAKGLAVKVSPPFDSRGTDEAQVPDEFREEGFKLTVNEPVRFEPLTSESGVYLIALKTNLPMEMPVFEKVQDKVLLDFKRDKAMQMARTTGTNFHRFLTNGLAQGRTFSELAIQNKVKTVSLPPISPMTRNLTNVDERISLPMVQQNAFDLKKGEVSPFVPTMEGGMIVYLRDKLPLNETKLRAELPDFIAQIGGMRTMEAFNAWFRKQAEQAQLIPPQRETVSPAAPRQPPRQPPPKAPAAPKTL